MRRRGGGEAAEKAAEMTEIRATMAPRRGGYGCRYPDLMKAIAVERHNLHRPLPRRRCRCPRRSHFAAAAAVFSVARPQPHCLAPAAGSSPYRPADPTPPNTPRVGFERRAHARAGPYHPARDVRVVGGHRLVLDQRVDKLQSHFGQLPRKICAKFAFPPTRWPNAAPHPGIGHRRRDRRRRPRGRQGHAPGRPWRRVRPCRRSRRSMAARARVPSSRNLTRRRPARHGPNG